MDERIEQVLKKIENIAEREKRYWNVPRTTGLFLNMMVKMLGAEQVLEIGTSNGYSGIFFAQALGQKGGRLLTIESHKQRFAEAQSHFQEAGVSSTIEQIFGHAPEIFSEIFDEKSALYRKLFVDQKKEPFFDLIFIDATKMEYASYFEVLFQYLKAGGLFIADNALSHQKEMSVYLNSVQAHPQLENALLPFDNGLMLSYKMVAGSS